MNDCSAFDHSNRWIFDAAIDLAQWPKLLAAGSSSEVFFGGRSFSPPQKKCLDKTLPKLYIVLEMNHPSTGQEFVSGHS